MVKYCLQCRSDKIVKYIVEYQKDMKVIKTEEYIECKKCGCKFFVTWTKNYYLKRDHMRSEKTDVIEVIKHGKNMS